MDQHGFKQADPKNEIGKTSLVSQSWVELGR